MQNGARATHRLDHGDRIADVAGDNRDEIAMPRFQPLRVFPNAGPGEIVERDNLVAPLGQRIGQIAADEAASAGDEDWALESFGTHATNPLLASSWVARST